MRVLVCAVCVCVCVCVSVCVFVCVCVCVCVCGHPTRPVVGLFGGVIFHPQWVAVRNSLWPSMEGIGPLFWTTRSPCHPVSYDNMRKVVASFYNGKTIGAHSFRKDGVS